MLLAVEGGGFFSSSASGYSKGLTLLLLGQKNEEKPMRVAPWNQYQLVDQETDPELQLASGKKRFVRGCASFVCFGRAAAGLESPSPLKVGPTQQQQGLPQPPVPDKGRDQSDSTCNADGGHNSEKFTLKSSLKKASTSYTVVSDSSDESLATSGKDSDVHTETRKVQWTDASGGELAEIREFEPSDDGSDDEFGNGNEKTCSCTIIFSTAKPTLLTIRSSQAEGPIRRPVAPSPSPVKPIPPSSPSSPTPSPAAASPPPPTPSAPPKPVAASAVEDSKNVITLEFQRQKAKELQAYFKQKKLDEANQGPFFGFIGKNEISNGRWAMFGFAVGMLTEYATGSDLVDQVKILLSNFGILDLE
ncbi:OLC1v1017640C1 [Oldenlandia corymbosa var. corymbosa]|uniref:OLC1v1017640C1 n=1 Tax=Oldenlandia corymbosa var. corymbosa TaxID=529605 RepID=A0AAV1E9U7_OLDCO|nr:OLC1v1017640C1 [Oldenlandia corymbosa var. corymbosa]